VFVKVTITTIVVITEHQSLLQRVMIHLRLIECLRIVILLVVIAALQREMFSYQVVDLQIKMCLMLALLQIMRHSIKKFKLQKDYHLVKLIVHHQRESQVIIELAIIRQKVNFAMEPDLRVWY
jgi:hypothetical protein